MNNVAELSKALFPFAENATRASLERTSRVLRRAGVRVDSVPPPGMGLGRASMASIPADPMPLLVKAQTRTSLGQSPGAQTRTAWDTAGVQRPRSGARTGLIIGGLVLVAGAGAFGALRWHQSTAPTVQADPPAQTVAARPQAGAVTPVPTVTADPAPPSVLTAASSAPPPSTRPTVIPSVPSGPVAPPHGRGGRGPKPGPVVSAVPPPVKPAKPPEDTDGFGDRK